MLFSHCIYLWIFDECKDLENMYNAKMSTFTVFEILNIRQHRPGSMIPRSVIHVTGKIEKENHMYL